MASMRADNIEDVKRMKLRESIDKALLKNAEPPIEFMNRLSKDKGLANYVVNQFFHLIMKDLNEPSKPNYKQGNGEMQIAAEP
jgi:type I restriction enzyme R subunit